MLTLLVKQLNILLDVFEMDCHCKCYACYGM